jgi:hemerythrin-like domain-containing protein
VDPVALLKCEHVMIMEHLRMIEAVIEPRRTGQRVTGRELAKPDLVTLRDLFRFFTGKVSVHFRREAVLITTLGRLLGRKREEREWLEGLLSEHRAMKAAAVSIVKTLKGKAAGAAAERGSDPFGIKAFVQHYRKHLLCEESVLFEMAEMRLTGEQKLHAGQRMLQM